MARIIVADDVPTHLEFVSTTLERAGHQVVAVAGGKACLLQFEERVDLVVTDIFMPDFDGFQLMAAIRAQKYPIPVIAMTGGMNGRIKLYIDMITKLGACAVLAKPFSGSELLDAVRACCPQADHRTVVNGTRR